MQTISFIIPCYHSALTITPVVEEIRQIMVDKQDYNYEIVLVNDHSPDNVFDVMTKLSKNDKNIKSVNLSKNFGQHGALMAGLNLSVGDIAVCLDDDGQTPANESFKLIEALNEDVDVAYASYKWASKKHSLFRNVGSIVNDFMLRTLLGKPADLEITSFFATKRFVVDEICKYTNSYPYIMGLVLRTTRSIVNIPVQHRNREIGSSGYTFKSLIRLWLNGFTAFSVKPLRVATGVGVLTSALGFLYIMYILFNRFSNPSVPLGYSSTMAVMLFVGGMLMLMLGIIGEYIGRIYITLNNSPQFVIKDKLNFETRKYH